MRPRGARTGIPWMLAASLFLPAGALAGSPDLERPARIALTPKGRAFVTEHGPSRLMIVDAATGEVTARVRLDYRPLGVAWSRGRLLVGNDDTGNVAVYRRRDGGWWRRGRLGRGQGAGFLPEPTDIAVDHDHRLVFVASGGKQAVLKFRLSRAYLGQVAGPGSEAGSLASPTGVAVDPARLEVLVSDAGDPRHAIPPALKIYDYDGTFLAEVAGSSGQAGFEFSRPQGLAVDGSGHIFLVDSLLGQILVFDRDTLQGIGTVGSYGSGTGQLRLPLDVAINPRSRDLLVTNNLLARIEIFPEEGGQP